MDFVKLTEMLVSPAAALCGTLLGGWLQSRISKGQTAQEHESQRALLENTHRHNIELMAAQQRREEDTRLRQFSESDRADRLVVLEYVDLLLPRAIEVSSIFYLGTSNDDPEELSRYLQLQKRMSSGTIDAAHPEKNLGLRMAFLLFQLTAAMRLALGARWTRPLSDEQAAFLSHWESHIEPMICSSRYPGKELMYREQIEIMTEEMLISPQTTKMPRPINWKEFCDKYSNNKVVRELAEMVAEKLRYIFVESNPLPPRRAMQCRLGIMALYLIRLSREAGNDSWAKREDGLWRTVATWYKWEFDAKQDPRWFVLKFGDVDEYLRARSGVASIT